MKTIKLNKSYLSVEQKNLKNYKKYLPSLELKRKKLLAERGIDEHRLKQLKQQSIELNSSIVTNLPKVTYDINTLKQLIQIGSIDVSQENLVGVKLPVFKSIQFVIEEYAYFNTPHWFDNLIRLISNAIEIQVQGQILDSRIKLLNQSIQTVTQRKNLFEKVLIPTALKNIRLIQIFLSDTERAAVVSSKISKKKRQLL